MRKILYVMLTLAMILSLIQAPLWAGEEEKPKNVSSPKLLTVDYVNAEVSDVIRALAAQSGINIAMNPNLKGLITVHLRETTLEEALQVVSNLAGLSAKKVKDTYVVATRGEMKSTLERLGSNRLVSLRNVTAQNVSTMLEGALPDVTVRPQGKDVMIIGADADLDAAEKLIRLNDTPALDSQRVMEKITIKHRTAAQAATALTKIMPDVKVEPAGDGLILSGIRSQVDTAKASLALLDVPSQADVDIRRYDIRYAAPAHLVEVLKRMVPEVQVETGPSSTTPSRPEFQPISGQFVGFKGGSGIDTVVNSLGVTQEPDGQKINKSALSLLLKGAPSAVEQALKVLELVDIPPKQMLIEAQVVETSPEVEQELGLKWGWTRFGFYESPKGTIVDTTKSNGPGGEFTYFTTRPLGFGEFSRVPWSFQAQLSAMITNRTAKLLANPNIMVVNDQDASIFIGDTLRFQTLATSGPTTGNQFTVIEVPVGIILLVHPRINDDGYVTLRIHPVVSTVTALVNGLPQTSAREAETTVRVKDGDTIAIGGLIRDEDIREMSKIPLLGDLPVIGHLFRHSNNRHRRTTVTVFLTIRLQKQ